MTAEIPIVEPSRLVAGDTLQFLRYLSDYQATDGWTLSYSLVKSSVRIAVTGSSYGDGGHLISVAAATTAAWTAGDYDWQSYVTKSTERYAIQSGRMSILTNFAAQSTGYDARSTWRQTVEQLEAGVLTLSTGAEMVRITHRDKVLEYRTMDDLLSMLAYARSEVAREEQTEAIANGRRTGSRVLGVFR